MSRGISAFASVTVRAPAKVNLELRVGAPRADGFHPLATIFQALALADDVSISVDPEITGIEISCGGELAPEQLAMVPLDASNLAVRAVTLAASALGLEPLATHLRGAGLRVHLDKRIPVAGGMAGGSADAAAVLVAMEALFGRDLGRAQRLALAAELGSDVAFPLLGGTAMGVGRGEQLSPLMVSGSYTWVLALSHRGLSTPAVFGELDRQREGRVLAQPRVSDPVISALRSGNARALGANLVNELQPAALSLRPELSAALRVGAECDVLGALVSGSGPTIALLVRDEGHGREVQRELLVAHAADEVLLSTGPAPGVRVVERVSWHI